MADRGSETPRDRDLRTKVDRVLPGQNAGKASSASRYAGVGLQFAISILVFLFAGQWLDTKLGSSPAFLLIGVFVGGGAAFYSMYRKLMADQRLEEEARQEGARHESPRREHGNE